MIILITGASHTGKTLLAQRLLEKLQIPYLSIDHLKMGLIRSGQTGLTPEDDAQLTAYLWPIVRQIIKTAIENGQHLTVDSHGEVAEVLVLDGKAEPRQVCNRRFACQRYFPSLSVESDHGTDGGV